MRRCPSEDGFTLVEVLVATAILALLLVPLLRSFSSGLVATTRSGALTQATLIASSYLETVAMSAASGKTDTVDRQDGPYYVTAVTRPYVDEGTHQEPGATSLLYEVVVTVAWMEGAQTRSIALRTLRMGAAAPVSVPGSP